MASLKLTLVLAAVAAASCAAPGGAPSPTGRGLPADVVAFRNARDACDHFRGEEPYDEERAAFLQARLEALCTGSDRRLATLRAKYADRPDVIAALAGYEDTIE